MGNGCNLFDIQGIELGITDALAIEQLGLGSDGLAEVFRDRTGQRTSP